MSSYSTTWWGKEGIGNSNFSFESNGPCPISLVADSDLPSVAAVGGVRLIVDNRSAADEFFVRSFDAEPCRPAVDYTGGRSTSDLAAPVTKNDRRLIATAVFSSAVFSTPRYADQEPPTLEELETLVGDTRGEA